VRQESSPGVFEAIVVLVALAVAAGAGLIAQSAEGVIGGFAYLSVKDPQSSAVMRKGPSLGPSLDLR
jgi:hypothetical protein